LNISSFYICSENRKLILLKLLTFLFADFMHLHLPITLRYQIALTLGKSINEALDLSFDFHLAKDSLCYFKAENIPKITTNSVPPLVTDVHFKADLTNIESVNPYEIASKTGLFHSL